jgi:homoserine kinase
MDDVAGAARRAGALGCVLSGAGPAMLAAVRGVDGDGVARAMEQALRAAGIGGRAVALPVDDNGATWERRSET